VCELTESSPNGSTDEWRNKLRIPDDAILVGHVGRLDPIKRTPFQIVLHLRTQPDCANRSLSSLGKQHDAAIRRDPSAIKGGSDLLALNGWKGERQQIIV